MSERHVNARSGPEQSWRRGRVAFLLLVVVATVGSAVWRHQTLPYHLLVCEPGTLYRSGRLEPDILAEVIEEYGIRTVVNLKSEDENRLSWHDAEVRATEVSGARHVDIAMDPETPPTPEQIETWLALFDDSSRTPVLVHCQHGVIRTGMLVAVYEMEFQDRRNAQVLADLVSFGHDISSPVREPMRRFVRTYSRRTARASARD